MTTPTVHVAQISRLDDGVVRSPNPKIRSKLITGKRSSAGKQEEGQI